MEQECQASFRILGSTHHSLGLGHNVQPGGHQEDTTEIDEPLYKQGVVLENSAAKARQVPAAAAQAPERGGVRLRQTGQAYPEWSWDLPTATPHL